ncbi:FAD/NAD(P)-binding domain-containing protein [Hypoxylon sp. EC38]|nr:FAD/NAD(P)-binding domain-containing protein [Hypoxylon sp. EC38]
MGSIETTSVEELDALIIGAGFSGVYQLKRLRDDGFKAKLVDAGSDYGGIWYWNRYPGARVDSHAPNYQFSDPELWQNYHWKQRFPDHKQLREYFQFVAEKWDLRKDTYFNTYISSATWDEAQYKWIIKANDGRIFKATFFLAHTGISASRSFPDWKGISSFKGLMVHSSYWPHDEPDLKGKRVAVVGTGSTGVQLSHAVSEVAGELVVFQRTPALCLPMRQVDYATDEGAIEKSKLKEFFEVRNNGYWGFEFGLLNRKTFDDDEVQRRATYEALWEEGDFKYWLGSYMDLLFDAKANNEAYKFWREKTRARINDPRIQDLLAPEEQPYPFGCKRVPLERGFYEIFNKPNVHLVDINKSPVVEVTEKGIRTTEKEWEFDVIILATGFDAVTGGLTTIDIRGIGNQSIKEKFSKHGPTTYCGICVAGFPNMFFSYGPQSPAAFSNGPTSAEVQCDWIADVMNDLRRAEISSIVADEAGEKAWVDHVEAVAYSSLLPKAKSWYMGDNIPGKPRASLMYLGGLPGYHERLRNCISNGYKDFTLKG